MEPIRGIGDSEADNLRLIHELEVRKIQLDLQNGELKGARDKAEEANAKFTLVYDNAPVGYFTLGRDCSIVELNRYGVRMLGKGRTHLKKQNFRQFIEHKSLPIFDVFIRDVFKSSFSEQCEIELISNKEHGNHIYLIGVADEEGQVCLITAIDINDRKDAEIKLQNSETRFRRLFESAKEGILILNAVNGQIVEANPYLIEMIGFGREEILGKELWEIGTFKNIAASKEAFSVLQHEKYIRFEDMPLETKDGVTIDVEFISNVYLSDGIKVIQCNIRNITDRKQLEQHLSKIATRTKGLIDAIPDLMFMLDKNGVFLDYKAEQDDLHYQSGSIIGKNNRDIAPPEFAALIETKIGEALKTKEVLIFEYQLQVPKKGLRSYEARMAQIGNEEVMAIARDITEQKTAQVAQREKAQLYYEMFEMSQAIKMVIDPLDGAIVDANSAASKFYGYPLPVLKTMNICNINMLTTEAVRVEMNRAITGQKSYYLFKHRLSTGEVRDVEVYSSPVQISGRMLLHSIVHDITERKIAEERLILNEARLRELNATKDKFFSIIGHDLRSPFNAIVGFSNLLSEQMKEKDYEGIEEYANIIQTSSYRAMSLLTDLLEWSFLQTGKMIFSPMKLDLVKLIDEVTGLANDSAHQKMIAITKELPTSAPVFVDGSMVKTILRNLVSNAVKYSYPRGEVSISAKQGPEGLTVAVHDNGVGMNKEAIEKLFRIETAHSTQGTNKEAGTGLGLLLCKDLIEKHRGRIWVESETGIGSTFFFTIPEIIDNERIKE